MDNLRKFGLFVREQRELRNLNQSDFSNAAKISNSTLVDIEKGRSTNPSSRAKVEKFLNENQLPDWATATLPNQPGIMPPAGNN